METPGVKSREETSYANLKRKRGVNRNRWAIGRLAHSSGAVVSRKRNWEAKHRLARLDFPPGARAPGYFTPPLRGSNIGTLFNSLCA